MNGSELEPVVFAGIASFDVLVALAIVLAFVVARGWERTVRDLTEGGAAQWSLTAKAVPAAQRCPAVPPDAATAPGTDGPSLTPAEVAALSAPEADGTVPGA